MLLEPGEVIGLIKPAVDAHTLGLASVRSLLAQCGVRWVDADNRLSRLADGPMRLEDGAVLEQWIRAQGVTRIGMSYRLDPESGAARMVALMGVLVSRRLLAAMGGPVRGVYFAGLPETCSRVCEALGPLVVVFPGDDSDEETLLKLGVPPVRIPSRIRQTAEYDTARMEFARDVLRRGLHESIRPHDRPSYPTYGTAADTLDARLDDARRRSVLPLMRAHVGPFLEDRLAAVRMMTDWSKLLAATGYLDILSLGTSQLTQSHFGQDWSGLTNGGGVPVQYPEEYRTLREAARPMLVRTYSGTTDVPALARIHEETLEIAWHALSFWWFCRLDGRGPNDLLTNLRQHFDTIRYAASTQRPVEPNVPHHFMFRGSDDVTYVVSALLAARAMASCGVRHMVLQTMLNTPRRTGGLADLARARAILALLRERGNYGMRITLQPRAGLDYFSTDLNRARAQLAAATALMDDIEPHNIESPQIIHVVSYCEAAHLATPPEVDESIRITRAAIAEYRRLRRRGDMKDMSADPDVNRRQTELMADARCVLSAIDAAIPQVQTPEGFCRVFAAGFLPVPDLWHCRQEFPEATRWRTAMMDGSVVVVDSEGRPVPAALRAEEAASAARQMMRRIAPG